LKDIEEYLRKGKSNLENSKGWQTMYQNKLSDNAWTLGD